MRKIIYITLGLVLLAIAVERYMSANNITLDPEIRKQLENPESIPKISWDMLYEFDYKTGKGPKELMALAGKLVKIPGYIVPLSGNYSKLDHFLLVPDGQSCIHVPPPPPNLIVTVNMRKAIPMSEASNPSWVLGVFKIESSDSQYGGSAYKIDGVKLEKFEFDRY